MKPTKTNFTVRLERIKKSSIVHQDDAQWLIDELEAKLHRISRLEKNLKNQDNLTEEDLELTKRCHPHASDFEELDFWKNEQ